VPDKNGNDTDIVVGFPAVKDYIDSTEAYYGAVVGRYANRIAKGKFSLDKEYILAVNNPPNHLHGGIKGFHAVVWDVVTYTDNSIRMQYLSADGEEGYPGNLTVFLEYFLNENDEMKVSFTAFTDKKTIVSLVHHAFFNLNGQGSGTILDHELTINADHYTPIDNTSIPFGNIEPVAETEFDFRKSMKIGARINLPTEQLTNGSGYDHNFVLNDPGSLEDPAAEVAGDKSGIKMKVFTTEPGMQLYSGSFMKGENILKGGYPDKKREAFCLETQHFPDSPNQPNFPSVVLNPGDNYESVTIFRFERE